MPTMLQRTLTRVTVMTMALLTLSAAGLAAPIIWWDGSSDGALAPPGKLLSDNSGYWGESVLTGVAYTFEGTPPDSPADSPAGRALLDGRPTTGVGLSGSDPLTVVFDFQRVCGFTEWGLITPTKRVAITLQVRESDDDPWQTAFTQDLAQCPDREFHRLPLDPPVRGRFARLTLASAETTRLSEILAWGDSAEDVPEQIMPVTPPGPYPVGVSYRTVTGISKSFVSDRESFYWVQSLAPQHRAQEAVWARVPTWSSLTHQPLLPDPEAVNRPIHIVMARNETENVALALRNTLVDSPRAVEVELGAFRTAGGGESSGLSGSLGVFGVIGSRNFGNNLGPIFEADNLLGRSLMQKYLLNGDEIQDFPRLTLPPSGGAVLWLSVTTDQTPPGIYRSYLRAAHNERIPLTVEVLNVTLPMTFAHVKTYSGNRTGMFPFEYADRRERDFGYALDSGISDWGSDEQVRAMAADRGMRLFHNLGFLIPFWTDPATDYVGMIWQGRWAKEADFPEDAPEAVAAKVARVVETAHSLGLSYDEWYGSTGDEPGAGNMEAIAYMARLIKQADPQVNLYVNPCYWAGWDHGGAADDATVSRQLRGEGDTAQWYRRLVDISMPLMLLLRDRPKSFEEFSSPRLVNSYYYVSAHLDRSENDVEIQKYRRMAWNSFRWGFNGWAFYAWYSPRGGPWDHFDEDGRERSDYQMVYPGPRGVIRTRHSEALREGWEDWRLLHLLKQQGRHAELQDVLPGYEHGAPLEQLRLQALRAAAPGEQ